MKINCIHCGHAFGIDGSYADYEGLVRCGTCGGLLDVKIDDGLIKRVMPGSMGAASHAAPTPAPPRAEPRLADDAADEAIQNERDAA